VTSPNGRPAEGPGYRNPPPGEGHEYWRIGFSLVALPFVAVLVSFFYFIQYTRTYSRGVAAALGIGAEKQQRTPDNPPEERRGRQEPAWTQFLFGPVWLDVRQVVAVGLQWQWDYTKNEFKRMRQKYFNLAQGADDHGLGTQSAKHAWIDGCGRAAAMAIAGALVELLLLVITAAQAVTIVTLWVLSLMAIYLLRGADTILLRMRSIRITCGTPNCYRHVPYPSYKCPGDGTLHRDVRPGRYGVIKRRCRCGRTFPTLLMLGSYKLQAYCPRCGQELLPDSGRHREIVLPIFGLPNAGKTQLLIAMAATARVMLERENGSAEPSDDYTSRWFEEAVSEHNRDKGPSRTLKVAQRPYSFRLSGPNGERVLRMFDAAGEIFGNPDRIRELQYMQAGRTFLFVIDPHTLPEFCALLPEAQRPEPDSGQRKRIPSQVLAEIVQNMHAMNINMKSARLRVIISKADMIEPQIAEAGIDDSDSIRDWLKSSVDEGGLGQANLCITAKTEFNEVNFALTNAKYKNGFDTSIERFTEAVLVGEGYKI
jgi:hypothetical protein